MLKGQLINLQRLERHYLQQLHQNGLESPQVVLAAVDLANCLLKDGQQYLKEQQTTQAEGFFMRAKEITTPITINSSIFYSTPFLMARGNAVLNLAQLYEKNMQFLKAYMTLKEVTVFMDKFVINKKANDEQEVFKKYIEILFHLVENCKMIKRKDEMLENCQKLIDIFNKLGINYEKLKTLTKEEFLTDFKKWYAILSRVLFYVGKSQQKVGFDKQALKNLYKSSQISELVFGVDDPKTIKSTLKYQRLSQKMEFDMLMGEDPIDFGKFKAEIQRSNTVNIEQVVNKKYKDFNRHIIEQVKSYQQVVSQLSHQATRYQMPEYVKKMREEYEQKLVQQSSDIKPEKELQFNKYKIKKKITSQMQSRATSIYNQNSQLLMQDKIFSPRLSLAYTSKKISHYQGSDKIDELKEHLLNTEYKASFNDLMIHRPQIKSEYIKVKLKEVEAEQPQQVQKPVKEHPKHKLIRQIQKVRQQKLFNIKTETQQSEQKPKQSVVTQQDQSKDKDIEVQELKIETQQSEKLQTDSQVIQLQVLQNPLFNVAQSEITEDSQQLSMIQELLLDHTKEELNSATNKIIRFFKKYFKQQKRHKSHQSSSRIKTNFSIGQIDNQFLDSNRIKTSMRLSIRETGSRGKPIGVGFGNLIKDFKNESENMTINRQKRIIQMVTELYQMPTSEVIFADKLLFDLTFTNWMISNPVYRVFSPFNVKQNEDEQTQIDQSLPLELRMQIQQIYRILQNNLAAKGLSLLISVQLSNYQRSYQIVFKITNFISYLDDIQKLLIRDKMSFLDCMLDFYFKQYQLQEFEFKGIAYSQQHYSLIQKLTSFVKLHSKVCKTEVGYKIISLIDIQELEYPLDEFFDTKLYIQNRQNYFENIRLQKKLITFLKPPRYDDDFYYIGQQSIFQNDMASINLVESDASFQESPQEKLSNLNRSRDNSLNQQNRLNPLLMSYHENPSYQDLDQLKSQFYEDYVKDTVEQVPFIERKQSKRLLTSIQHMEASSPQIKVGTSSKIMAIPHHPHKSAFGSNRKSTFLLRRPTQAVEEKKQQDQVGEHPINQSFRDFLKDNFPELTIADLNTIENYKLGTIADNQILEEDYLKDYLYFQPQGQIIRPEPLPYVREFPNNYLILIIPFKSFGKFEINRIVLDDQNQLWLLNERQKNKINYTFSLNMILNRQIYLDIIQQVQSPIILEEEEPRQLDQLIQLSTHRIGALTLNRFQLMHDHYNKQIKCQANQYIESNSQQNADVEEKIRSLTMINFVSNPISELNSPIIKIRVLTDRKYSNNINQVQINEPMFQNYRSVFKLNEYQFNYAFNKKYGRVYYRIQIQYKEQKTFDTSILYLVNQQAKQEKLILKKDLQNLLYADQICMKIKIYMPYCNQTYYNQLNNYRDTERICHILNNNVMNKYLLRLSSNLQKRQVGTKLVFSQNRISQETRNQEKYSELDQFLLLYIQNPHLFTIDAQEKDRQIKSTILFYFFKQQLKLTLITQNSQRYFMKTYFHTKKFYSYSRISNLGKVFVESSVFKFNQLYQSLTDHVFYYFQIIPFDSRTKNFKLVLDITDLINLVWPKLSIENCMRDYVVQDLVKRLCAFLVCTRTTTYTGLKLPLSYFSANSQYDLCNTFTEVTYGSNLLHAGQTQIQSSKTPKYKYLMNDQLLRKKSSTLLLGQNSGSQYEIEQIQQPLEVIKVLTNHSMLTPIYRGQRVIYKQIKKVQNNYIIITVSLMVSNLSFQLSAYTPTTCRNFVCYIRQTDFQNMDYDFLDSIFPSQLTNKNLMDHFSLNRWKFNEINQIYDVAKTKPEEFEEYFNEARNVIKPIPMQEIQKLTESKISLSEEYDDGKMNMLMFPDESKANSSDSQRFQNRSSTQPPIFLKKSFSKQMSAVTLPINRKSLGNINHLSANKHSTEKLSHFIKFSPKASQENSTFNLYEADKDMFYQTILLRKNIDTISMFEIKIWEQLINQIEIFSNDQSINILKLNTFRGVLTETLHSSIVYLGHEDNAHFEVFILNKKKPIPLFNNKLPIRISESTNYSLYIRITFFEKPIVVNLKMMLRKPLVAYFKDEKMNLQNLSFTQCPLDQYEFILADLRKCAIYLLNKMRKNYVKEANFNLQGMDGDKKCPQIIKVNLENQDKLQKMVKIILYQKQKFSNYEYIQIIRQVFTISPPQLMAIFYREKKQQFYIYIYNTITNKDIVIRLNLKEVQQNIPNVLALLQLKLHQEIGNRIYRSFKNNLIIKTFQIL